MRKVIIVNATGAKHGGAREILRRYIESLSSCSSYRYLILCPKAQEFSSNCVHDNVEFIEKETAGVMTYFFSTFLIAWYVVKYKADVLFSFNNLNVLAPVAKRITYFHQEKAINGRGMRFALIRLNIRLMKGTRFVVQSNRIRRHLIDGLRINPGNVMAKWPGVRHINILEKGVAWLEVSHLFSLNNKECVPFKKIAFLPVYDAEATHKDFKFFNKIKKILNESGYATVSLCPQESGVADFNLGLVTVKQMDLLYSCSDALLLISTEETLCLPMFEYAQTGKPVIALEADYIVEFKKEHPEWLNNTHVISKGVISSDFKILLREMLPVSVPSSAVNKICQGQWDIKEAL